MKTLLFFLACSICPGPKPAGIPASWKPLIGQYASGDETINVFERDGQLLPPGASIRNGILRIGDKTYTRLSDRAGHIEAVRPVSELLPEALAATPPVETGDFREPELTEVVKLDSTIKLDIRYATSNNFMGTPFYSEARAFLQRPAAEAVLRAHRTLKSLGYGIIIHDGYRPWYVTKMFWDGTPADKHNFVADPAHGSRHNRGCAVDLSLYDLATGKEIEMTGGYDEMSTRSYPNFEGGTSLQRWHRDLLRNAMQEQGFQVYEYEWWHFDYKDWPKYRVLNKRFEDL